MKAIRDFPEFDGHELVTLIEDESVQLRGVIAIHNTNLGPATGGTRYEPYASLETAVRDALRLSRAMTYKCALAGIPYGGGKGVIIGNPQLPKPAGLLAAYAEEVNALKGKFYTGEDAGMRREDIKELMSLSPYVNGHEGKAGSLAPWTALGIFAALKAGLRSVFGTDTLKGHTIAIKGLGKIGFTLATLAHEHGMKIWAADVNPIAAEAAEAKLPGIKLVDASIIHTVPVDVYSPNALGGEFTEKNVAELRTKLVCGGANNQLATPAAGEAMHRRGILYLPDYVVNAGGLITIMAEVDPKGFDKERVLRQIERIGETTENVITMAARENIPTAVAADQMAEKIFHNAAAKGAHGVVYSRH